MTHPSRSAAAGITIIEIIISVGIGVVLITALMRFLVAAHPLAKVAYLQARSNETARLQLKRLASTVRSAQPADTGAYALSEASPNRLIFYANVDTDTGIERVRYELVGTTLVRGITEPTGNPVTYDLAQEKSTTVAVGVHNGATPVFTYYDGEYPTDQTPLSPADVTDVKYIQFHLLIDANVNVDPPAVDVVSQVQLRNLKTNLGDSD